MPKLFSIGGYIVYFWSGEGNEPVHVHVSRGRPETNSAKVWLTEDGGCLVAGRGDISEKNLRNILKVISANHAFICNEWEKYFGALLFYR